MNEKGSKTAPERGTDSACPKNRTKVEVTDKELGQVHGGSAFDKVPTVPLNDYDDEIRGRS